MSLNLIYYNIWPNDPDAFALLSFISFAPYFAWIYIVGENMGFVSTLLSYLYFVVLGCLIARHFGLSLIYGIAIGSIQGAVLPLISYMWFPSNRGNPIMWVSMILVAWICMDYIIASTYGIAVLPPIQLYRYPLLLQPISIAGFASIDALVISCNILIGIGIGRWIKKEPGVGNPLAVMSAVLSAWVVVSSLLWASAEDMIEGYARVSTVSPGSRTGDSGKTLEDMLYLTLTTASTGSQFIVWPEEYVIPPFGYTCEDHIFRHILPGLQDVDAYVVIGCEQTLHSVACPTANLAFTIAPHGESILGFYGKQHPVSMIGEESCIQNGYKTYPTEFIRPGSSFSTLICYDMDFPDSSAIVTDLGASLILNPSEDWAAARGHFAASVFRAVENRVAVAKTDWGWDSAIIDPFGRTVASCNSVQIQREVLTANVAIFSRDVNSNYLRQHVLPYACFAIAVIFIIIRVVRKYRAWERSDGMQERLIARA